MHGGYGIFAGMGFMGLLLVVLVIYLIIYTLGDNRNPKQSDESDVSENRALDLLNERYAKGEIDDEEYNRRKNTLKD